MDTSDLDFWKTLARESGLLVALLITGWSYRREFLRKIEDKDRELRERKEEKDSLKELLEQSTSALTNSAVAIARQTDATHRLARTVENLDRRIGGLAAIPP